MESEELKHTSNELERLGLAVCVRHDCVGKLEWRDVDVVGLSIGGGERSIDEVEDLRLLYESVASATTQGQTRTAAATT